MRTIKSITRTAAAMLAGAAIPAAILATGPAVASAQAPSGPSQNATSQVTHQVLPSWLSYRYQAGTRRHCVIIFNTTPRGDTSVRMCRGGLVDTS